MGGGWACAFTEAKVVLAEMGNSHDKHSVRAGKFTSLTILSCFGE